MKPKELFTSKKTFAAKQGSGRVNVKDRLSLPDRRGSYVNEFTSEKSSRRFNDDRQMGVNSGMNNMMEMMGGNNMGMGMADMMNPMMNFMNMQQQQELNMMMMNQNSMNSMMNQNKDMMMGHSKRGTEPPISTDLSRKRGFPGGRNNEPFDVPAKKSFSGRSGERRDYSGRMSPEREKPSFGSGRPAMLDDRAAKQRRGEELEEEIAKYERELQLPKKMKELKEERSSMLGSSSSRYGASSFSSSSKYNDYSRNDSYSRGGAMSPLSRGGDESRYGRRDRSPVGSKYDSTPRIGYSRDALLGEKRYGSSNAFSSSYTTSSARGGSSGRDKPMDSWLSARPEGSSFGGSSRYDSGPSRSGGAAGFSSLGIKPAGPADNGFKYEPTRSSYSAYTSSGDTGSRYGSSSFAGSKSGGGASSFGRGGFYGGSKSSFNNRR